MLLSILAFLAIAVLSVIAVLSGTYCKWVFFGGPPRVGRTGPTLLLLVLFAIALAFTATTGGVAAGVGAVIVSFVAGMLS